MSQAIVTVAEPRSYEAKLHALDTIPARPGIVRYYIDIGYVDEAHEIVFYYSKSLDSHAPKVHIRTLDLTKYYDCQLLLSASLENAPLTVFWQPDKPVIMSITGIYDEQGQQHEKFEWLIRDTFKGFVPI